MSSELGEMRSHRRRPPSPAAAPPLDDDDLLAEILLRLPPEPSSLPRASAVCKRWHSLASDAGFSRRFRRHHRRNPPLLGCFMKNGQELHFEPTLGPPNRLRPPRFPFPIDVGNRRFTFLGCRHGFVLVLHTSPRAPHEFLVWDPLNGREHHLAIPPGFDEKIPINGAVLRSALGDIQGFQVVLVSTDLDQRIIARVYSSETGAWGDLIAAPLPPNVSDISLQAVVHPIIPAVLAGDSLYTLFLGKSSGFIEFDVGRRSLAVIPLPVGLDPKLSPYFSVIRAEGGGLGLLFASMSDNILQLWERKTTSSNYVRQHPPIMGGGVDSWVLGRTIELASLLSLDLQSGWGIRILGFAEENAALFLWAFGDVFMVQLDSLRFKKLPEINSHQWYPFEGVYAAGI